MILFLLLLNLFPTPSSGNSAPPLDSYIRSCEEYENHGNTDASELQENMRMFEQLLVENLFPVKDEAAYLNTLHEIDQQSSSHPNCIAQLALDLQMKYWDFYGVQKLQSPQSNEFNETKDTLALMLVGGLIAKKPRPEIVKTTFQVLVGVLGLGSLKSDSPESARKAKFALPASPAEILTMGVPTTPLSVNSQNWVDLLEQIAPAAVGTAGFTLALKLATKAPGIQAKIAGIAFAIVFSSVIAYGSQRLFDQISILKEAKRDALEDDLTAALGHLESGLHRGTGLGPDQAVVSAAIKEVMSDAFQIMLLQNYAYFKAKAEEKEIHPAYSVQIEKNRDDDHTKIIELLDRVYSHSTEGFLLQLAAYFESLSKIPGLHFTSLYNSQILKQQARAFRNLKKGESR